MKRTSQCLSVKFARIRHAVNFLYVLADNGKQAGLASFTLFFPRIIYFLVPEQQATTTYTSQKLEWSLKMRSNKK